MIFDYDDDDDDEDDDEGDDYDGDDNLSGLFSDPSSPALHRWAHQWWLPSEDFRLVVAIIARLSLNFRLVFKVS